MTMDSKRGHLYLALDPRFLDGVKTSTNLYMSSKLKNIDLSQNTSKQFSVTTYKMWSFSAPYVDLQKGIE